MQVTPTQVEEFLDRRVRESGLGEFVNRKQSQFLELEDDFFVEVVLNDGAVLEDVEKVVKGAADELKPQGVKLDIIVRAVWEVEAVEYVGPSRSSDGGLRAALAFRGTLKSGRRTCFVTVDVFWGAVEVLESRLGLKKFVGQRPNAAETRDLANEMLLRVVRKFLQFQSAAGGTSYWDPLLRPQLELNAPAMSFILGQSTAFEELRQAIADAFEPPVLDSFIGGLASSRITIKDFEIVLPEFSNMLGGAYRQGQKFSTSAEEIYRRLDRSEQALLKKYFNAKITQLMKDPQFQEVRRRYPTVFRK